MPEMASMVSAIWMCSRPIRFNPLFCSRIPVCLVGPQLLLHDVQDIDHVWRIISLLEEVHGIPLRDFLRALMPRPFFSSTLVSCIEQGLYRSVPLHLQSPDVLDVALGARTTSFAMTEGGKQKSVAVI